jgi:hypothetical protein
MRLLTRAVARSAWIECQGCGEDAIIGFQSDRRLYGLDPALVALLVQIALALWKYWHEQKIDTPSIVPSALEPIDWESDDDDEEGVPNDAD